MPKLLLVMGLRYDEYKLEVAIELDDDLKKTI